MRNGRCLSHSGEVSQHFVSCSCLCKYSAASLHEPVYVGSAPPHSLLLSAPSLDFWLSKTQSGTLARHAAPSTVCCRCTGSCTSLSPVDTRCDASLAENTSSPQSAGTEPRSHNGKPAASASAWASAQ